MVAALFVEKRGVYSGLEGVDLWDEARDARKYAGPWPVVAHPPCARWCQLAGLVEHRYPKLKKGQDGGTFASALSSVRQWGGVLEHPAYSKAWPAHGLADPPIGGGWQRTIDGGWVCEVSQAAYGHRARKLTWLYAFGYFPPVLNWERPDTDVSMTWCRNHGGKPERMGKRERNHTPAAFRDLLLSIARSAAREVAA